MGICTKCGRKMIDNDLIYWKCTQCGKVFNANFGKLKNLWKQKQTHPGQALLKCPGCGYGIDDGNEILAYKCPDCGVADRGNLEKFVNSDNDIEINPDNIMVNNLIKCPDCGKQISLNADTCPNCGHPFRKKKKHSYKIMVGIIVILAIALVAGWNVIYRVEQNNKHQEKINNIVEKIDLFMEKALPTQKEYDDIMRICDGLTDEEKEEISNLKKVEKYKNINLNKVNNLFDRIKMIDINTSFKELEKIENEYNKFNDAERNLLDISNVINSKKIIEIEKQAVKYLNNAVPICADVMYTIYDSWFFQVHFNIYSYKLDGTILDEYTSEVNIPESEVVRIIKAMSNMEVDEILILGFLTNIEYNIKMIITYFEDNGTYANIKNNLEKAKKYIKMLDDKSEKKKKLQRYYNSVNKYYNFIKDPKCSFDQLADIEVELNKEVEDCKNDLSWN